MVDLRIDIRTKEMLNVTPCTSVKPRYNSSTIPNTVHRQENHCSRTAQSSRGGCSRRVHEIVCLAVKKGNILVNYLLLKIFIANYYHL